MREVTRHCSTIRNSATTSIDLTSSEYGRSDDRREPDGNKLPSGFFFSLACHSRSVIARSARGKALNHQSQTRRNGIDCFSHPIEATLGDFATSESAETEERPIRMELKMRERRLKNFNKTGKSYSVPSLPDGVYELGLIAHNRLCSKCWKSEVYQDIKTMDWCEECIWEFVRDTND